MSLKAFIETKDGQIWEIQNLVYKSLSGICTHSAITFIDMPHLTQHPAPKFTERLLFLMQEVNKETGGTYIFEYVCTWDNKISLKEIIQIWKEEWPE